MAPSAVEKNPNAEPPKAHTRASAGTAHINATRPVNPTKIEKRHFMAVPPYHEDEGKAFNCPVLSAPITSISFNNDE
ncbi:hypothetical protein GCM10010982_36000 [Bowmanella pacifica]|uniref:Uncharacterized protein n=1 Tax=Bowmanella pacifica TaxID=502051 RepID=A0A917Z6C5_9ALTE|nr:hypothetical protein GCM10010982_36000 [Bowmanella pacifica]